MLEYSKESEELVKNSQSAARVSSLFICLVCCVPEDMLEYSDEEWVNQSTAGVGSLFMSPRPGKASQDTQPAER